MSPPEVWGPSIWTLFHTLADRISEEGYPYIYQNLFNLITRICKYLPCPECANDATNFLLRIKPCDIKTKLQFKNTFYLFHNYVNAKKRKRLFNYANINVYSKFRLMNVISNFINNYQTKGNMKLISESFQRQFVINDFKNFIKKYIKLFIPIIPIPNRLIQVDNDIGNRILEKETIITKPIENENLFIKENIPIKENESFGKKKVLIIDNEELDNTFEIEDLTPMFNNDKIYKENNEIFYTEDNEVEDNNKIKIEKQKMDDNNFIENKFKKEESLEMEISSILYNIVNQI